MGRITAQRGLQHLQQAGEYLRRHLVDKGVVPSSAIEFSLTDQLLYVDGFTEEVHLGGDPYAPCDMVRVGVSPHGLDMMGRFRSRIPSADVTSRFTRGLVSVGHEMRHAAQKMYIQRTPSRAGRLMSMFNLACGQHNENISYYAGNWYHAYPEVDAELYGVFFAYKYIEAFVPELEASTCVMDYVRLRASEEDALYVVSKDDALRCKDMCDVIDMYRAAREVSKTARRSYSVPKKPRMELGDGQSSLEVDDLNPLTAIDFMVDKFDYSLSDYFRFRMPGDKQDMVMASIMCLHFPRSQNMYPSLADVDLGIDAVCGENWDRTARGYVPQTDVHWRRHFEPQEYGVEPEVEAKPRCPVRSSRSAPRPKGHGPPLGHVPAKRLLGMGIGEFDLSSYEDEPEPEF